MYIAFNSNYAPTVDETALTLISTNGNVRTYKINADGDVIFTCTNSSYSFVYSIKVFEGYGYSVKAMNGDTELASLTAGIGENGASTSVFWSKYIKVDDQWYSCAETTATFTEGGEKTVECTASGIKEFFETTDMAPSKQYSGAPISNNATYSNGNGVGLYGDATTHATITTPSKVAAGSFDISIYAVQRKSNVDALNIYTSTDGTTWSEVVGTITISAATGLYTTATPITLTEDSYVKFENSANGNQNHFLDYITFTPTYAYTIKAKAGGTEKILATGYANGTITIPYPRYINVGGTLYTKNATKSEYRVSQNITEDNQVVELAYKATDITNVVYFSEGEDIEGASKCDASATNIGIRSSNAACGYAGSDITLINTLPAGAYKVTSVLYANNKSTAMSIKYQVGSNEFTNENKDEDGNTFASNGFTRTNEFTLTDAADFKWLTSGNSKNGLDFIYIQEIDNVTAKITSAGYATFSSLYNIDADNITGATAYVAQKSSNDSYVHLEPVTGIVPANTGLIIKGDEGTVTIPTSTETGTTPEPNYLVAVTADNTEIAAGNYVLGQNKTTKEVGFFLVGTELPKLNAGQAYLSSAISGAKALYFSFDDDITGIENVNANATANNAVRYNLAGQRVSANAKGIVIVNGKKYLNK